MRGLSLVASYAKDYYRTPVNVGLILIVPVVFVVGFGESLSGLADLVGEEMVLSDAVALSALWSATLLTGTTGFFMLSGAHQADRRLVVAGYRPLTVVTARLATVVVLGTLITGISLGTLLLRTSVRNPWTALAAILLGALIYAALGVLIGSLIKSDLEGSFAVLFVFMMDAFIGGTPLTDLSGAWLELFPLYNPAQLVVAEVAGRPHQVGHWWYSLAYLAVLTTLAAIGFYRTARAR